MRFPNYFEDAKEPVVSFEVFPPKTRAGLRTLQKRLLPELVALNPSYITVTYGAMGTTRDRTLEIASYIKNKHNLETACHLTCVGSTRSELSEIINQISDAGIQNIVALRGDAPQGDDAFVPPDDGISHATELVAHIRTTEDPNRRFGVAVAGYPEKHLEAESFDSDIANLKNKLEMGGDIVITQLFYNNSAYFSFVKKVREAGIEAPIVPGLMPIQSAGQIQRITAMCGASLPDDLRAELDSAKDDDEKAVEIGIRQCIQQVTELLEYGVAGFHFYVLNKSYQIRKILYALPM